MYSTDVLPLFLPASQDELDAGITLLHRMGAWLPVFYRRAVALLLPSEFI